MFFLWLVDTTECEIAWERHIGGENVPFLFLFVTSAIVLLFPWKNPFHASQPIVSIKISTLRAEEKRKK